MAQRETGAVGVNLRAGAERLQMRALGLRRVNVAAFFDPVLDALFRGTLHIAVDLLHQLPAKIFLGVGQRHPILRTPRTCEARLDAAEIEFERIGEDGLRRSIGAEQALLLAVRLDQREPITGLPVTRR